MTNTAWDKPEFAAAWNDTYGLTMERAASRKGLVYPWLENRIGAFDDLTLTDFGCGNGNLIAHFQDRAFGHWRGYDSGSAILETARHIIDPRVSFQNIDLTSVQHGFPKADIVTSMFVIEEIPHPRLIEFFRNVAGALKPDGRAFFVTNHPAYAMVHARENADNPKFPGHRGYFDTAATLYALSELNQRLGHEEKIAYHHKPISDIFSMATTAGLRIDSLEESPQGAITMEQWRGHTPKAGDFPRFLFLGMSLR